MPGGKYYDYIFNDTLPSFLEAKVRGKIYDLNVGYPGLLLGGENWVFGFLLSFEDLLLLESTFSGFCKKILKLPFSSKVRTCNLGC